MRIRNLKTLLSHGDREGREVALSILEDGLEASDPYRNVMKMMWLEGSRLIIDQNRIELNPLKRHERIIIDLNHCPYIYVIGGGKAAQRMAKGIEDVLGDRITRGNVNSKKGEGAYLRRIGVTQAGHPLPDQDSVDGAELMVDIATEAGRRGKESLVFYSLSGGYTALTTDPPQGITLKELCEVQDMLYFECGAPIWDLNNVRDVLSKHKAGRLEKLLYPAKVIRFLTNESWPKGKMEKLEAGYSYENAAKVLKDAGIWERCPASVKRFLERADKDLGPVVGDQLKELMKNWSRVDVMDNEYMMQGAKAKAEAMGINVAILSHAMSGEAVGASEYVARIAQEIEDYGRPLEAPAVLLMGGELTVRVGGAKGRGGRNQEFALSSAQYLEGSQHIVVASADSDGTDGPTDMAGGIADAQTMDRARELKIDVKKELVNHNSNEALSKLGDTILTGAQGTNVQDLRVIYISA